MFNKILIASCALILLSCAKDDNSENNTLNENQAVDGTAKALSGDRETHCMEAWYGPPHNLWSIDCNCIGSEGNCVGAVSVNPDFYGFADSVTNGTVDRFFEGSHHRSLFAGVNNFNTHLPGLRDGTLTFTLFEHIGDQIVYAALHKSSDVITKSNIGNKAIIVIPFELN